MYREDRTRLGWVLLLVSSVLVAGVLWLGRGRGPASPAAQPAHSAPTSIATAASGGVPGYSGGY